MQLVWEPHSEPPFVNSNNITSYKQEINVYMPEVTAVGQFIKHPGKAIDLRQHPRGLPWQSSG